MSKLIYVCDNARHLICVPYSTANLHKMAKELELSRSWFHNNHYDIPKKRIEEITKQCRVVSSKIIVDIIKRPDFAHDLISVGSSNFGKPKGPGFEVTYLKEKGIID